MFLASTSCCKQLFSNTTTVHMHPAMCTVKKLQIPHQKKPVGSPLCQIGRTKSESEVGLDPSLCSY